MMPRFALVLSLSLLLAACAIDPCTIDRTSPTCSVQQSQANATIGAIDADRALRATDAAVYLAGQATKSAISSQATRAVVDAAATHIAIQIVATRQAISAQSTQSAVALAATQTSIDGEATKIAVSTGAVVERARIESSAAPYSAMFNIGLLWFAIPLLVVAAILVYGRRSVHAVTQSLAQALSKRTALITYGPANNPQLALVLYDADHQPIKLITTEGLIGPYAQLADGNTMLDRLDVPDELKLAALVEDRKRSQAARIAAATGSAPWGSSIAYESPSNSPAIATATISPLSNVPTFSELLRNWRPQPDRILFGFDQSGPLYGRLDQLLSVIVIGRQGVGKTNLLRFIYAQCLLIGAEVNAWDIHEDIIADLPGAQIYTTPQSIVQSAGATIGELDRRIASGEKHAERPLMTLIDEFNSLSYAVPDAIQAVARIVTEGRKYNDFCTVSCKGAPAAEFSKAYIRDAFSARYAFNTTTRQALMIGFDREDVQQVRTLEIGQALFDGPVPARLVRIPLITSADVQNLLPASQPFSEVLRPASPHFAEAAPAEVLRPGEAAPEVAGEAAREAARDPFDEVDEARLRRQRIADLLRSGASRNAIIREVYNATGGERYQKAAIEINKIQKEMLS